MSESSGTPDPADHVAERWQPSPLTREAVVRIFDKMTGGKFDFAPAVQPHREALYLTLADLVAIFIEYGSRPGWPTSEQARRVGRAIRELEAGINATSGTREPAPSIPQPLAEAIKRWAEAHSTSLFGKGRPPSEFDYKVYPLLLALYALAFGRKPSAAGGPTHRFVQCTFEEVHRVLGGESRRWEVPSSEGLKKRLPTFLSDSMRESKEREVCAIFERIQAELSRAERGK